MKPPQRAKTDFERVPKYDEWIAGKILDIAYEAEHKSTFQGEEKVRPAVRFKIGLEGCQFPKYSRWLTFSYGDKSNLYKNWVSVLVDGAEPDMDLDLDVIKGMSIKTMWSENGDYDNLVMVRPVSEKVKAAQTIEQVPF